MQLKDPKRGALAAAALSLLGATPAASADTSAGEGWRFDFATLLYSESDGRVQAIEPKLRAEKSLGNDRSIGATATIDVLSGASPNGAAPSSHPQTFSGSSGGGGYTVPAYELPKDPNFEDQRVALDLDYQFPLGLRDHFSVSAAVSKESDYTSLGGGAHWAHDFNAGNTTLGFGLNYANDTVNPKGGVPQPLSKMVVSTSGDEGGGEGGEGGGGNSGISSKGKQVIDLMAGVTQLLSPHSLMQVSYSASRSTGYLNDPYKILSVVDSNANPLYYVHEARPDHRLKQALYGQYKQFIRDNDVVDVSYRFMTDDWGTKSHTVDATYRWNFAATQYLEPHLRWYRQNQADFYHAALDQGMDTQLQFASSDPRLGAFSAYTAGLKYGRAVHERFGWNIRVEYYTQHGQVAGLPPLAGTALTQFDIAPSLNAAFLILGCTFR
jgi:hypothetical protein